MGKRARAVSLRQEYNAEIWKNRIAACRSSGQGVKGWCAEKAICVQTYYRWERKLLAETGNSRAAAQSGRFAQLLTAAAAEDSPAETNEVVAVLHTKGMEWEIRSGITAELLSALVRSMNGHRSDNVILNV